MFIIQKILRIFTNISFVTLFRVTTRFLIQFLAKEE